MPAGGPAYLRADDQENFDCKGDSNDVEYKLHVTGLRQKSLLILIVILAVLIFLAFAVLTVNIIVIRVLGLTPHGMKHLRFHSSRNAKNGEEGTFVEFVAENLHLGRIIAKTGYVNGSPGKDFTIHGSRVITENLNNKSRFVLHDGTCRFENVEQFMIKNQQHPIFSAKHPVFRVDRRIKKISTTQIITNKIRSPINENLHVDIENLSIRGNEGVRMEAKGFNITARNKVHFKTSNDGRLTFNGNKMYIGSNWLSLPISSSPALTASVDAFRICICIAARPKLFVVAGNKPCVAPQNFCT